MFRMWIPVESCQRNFIIINKLQRDVKHSGRTYEIIWNTRLAEKTPSSVY